VLNIYGGKITTHRRLAEAALAKLAAHLPKSGPSWTATGTLPGGDFPVDGVAAEAEKLRSICPPLAVTHARRLVRAYGTRARLLVADVKTEADWGERFGADLTEREVDYLITHEWAETAEDILWRRSKLGLHVTAADAQRLASWLDRASARTAMPLAAAAGGAA
jgi:glycerol-3-phosphate dehydrogenase